MIATVLTIELPGPLWMWGALVALWMLGAAVSLFMDARLTYWRYRLERTTQAAEALQQRERDG